MLDLVQDDAGCVTTLNVVQDAVQYGSVCCMFIVQYRCSVLLEHDAV